MKKLVISILLLSSSAFALPVVKSVTQRTDLVPLCATCDGGVFVTTTTFQVMVATCKTLSPNDFNVKAVERQLFTNSDAYVLVSVDLKPNIADCRALPVLRTYPVTTINLMEGNKYILENPSVILE